MPQQDSLLQEMCISDIKTIGSQKLSWYAMRLSYEVIKVFK